MVYLVLATLATRRFAARTALPATSQPAVTVLKPLCGNEPQLYDNLRSFCRQDYPKFQIVFGAGSADDPAVGVVQRLIAEHPDAELTLVCDEPVKGPNRKVGKLENMVTRAEHDVLVVADSDIRVDPGYLARIVRPLEDPAVGLVTCLFRGRPTDGFWSRFRAMWFNYDFFPSVLFSRWLGLQIGCFGSTMVLRRESLAAIGDFASIRDQLADDYALGAAVRRTGKRVVLCDDTVDSTIHETGFRSLSLHELRWGRTLRSVAPIGYAASVLGHPLALAALAALLGGFGTPSLFVLATALAVRLWMTREIDRSLGLPSTPVWLVPLRDALSFLTLFVSLWGTRVVWRKRSLRLAPGGRLVTDQRSP
jgi:ceramide glucosyltransferase